MDGELGMKVEIARLRVEADNGRVALQNLQRNYESLSAAYQERQSELEECARLLEEEGERADGLERRLEGAEARLREALRPKTPVAAVQLPAADPAALAALEEELERVRFQASVTETRAKVSNEKLQEIKDHLRQSRAELKSAAERLAGSEEAREQLAADLRRAEERAGAMGAEADAARARARELQAGSGAAEARAADMERRERKAARMLDEAGKAYREAAHRVSELEGESKTQLAALEVASRQRRVLEDQHQAASRRGDDLARAGDQCRRELEELQGVRRDLARKVAVLASDKADLKAQLANLEARYGTVVGQSAEKDGLSSGLASDLRAAKESLAAAEREAAVQRDQSDAKVSLLRKRIAQQNREADVAERSASDLKWGYAQALRGALRGLETCSDRCDRLWDASIKGVLASEKRLESLCELAGLRFPQVDALERDSASLLSRLEERAAALSGQVERWKSVAASRGEDASGSQREFETLSGQLRDSKNAAVQHRTEAQGLRAELTQQREGHSRELEALRLGQEAQLTAQQDKIDSRLRSLQRAMEDLQASSEAQNKEEASAHANETSRLQKTLDGEKESHRRLRDSVAKVLDVQAQTAEDVALAVGHVRKLGGLQPASPGGLGKAGDDAAEDALKRSQQLRLQVSEFIQVSQDVASKRVGRPQKDPKLDEREQELQKAVSRVIHIEESLGSCYTCIACLEVFRDPVMCVPCGHHFCRGCLPSSGAAGSSCPECGTSIETVVVDEILESLCSKYEVKMSALKAVSTLGT